MRQAQLRQAVEEAGFACSLLDSSGGAGGVGEDGPAALHLQVGGLDTTGHGGLEPSSSTLLCSALFPPTHANAACRSTVCIPRFPCTRLQVTGMACASCSSAVEAALQGTQGVLQASVSLLTGRAEVRRAGK